MVLSLLLQGLMMWLNGQCDCVGRNSAVVRLPHSVVWWESTDMQEKSTAPIFRTVLLYHATRSNITESGNFKVLDLPSVSWHTHTHTQSYSGHSEGRVTVAVWELCFMFRKKITSCRYSDIYWLSKSVCASQCHISPYHVPQPSVHLPSS